MPEVAFYLGKSYSFAHDLDIAGSWEKSVKYLGEFIKNKPQNVEARYMQAKNYMDKQNYEEALAEYEYVNKLEPNGPALKFMAITKMYMKKEGAALEDLRKYIKYNPKDEYANQMLNAIEADRVNK